ncbi:MAG: rhodanese-like domain-containing protein [Verrucomicrobia bacterium]|nr:rhodanese-like domain-containing protein [Verrucomicrobiota bacterium]
MDYWIWIFLGVFLVWILWFKQRGKVGADQAKEFVKSGALILDVGTEKEFSKKHIPGVVNLPLHELVEKISTLESDKSQVILCHCLSGGRSAIAMSRLRKLGYSQAYNLGSYGQATAVLKN